MIRLNQVKLAIENLDINTLNKDNHLDILNNNQELNRKIKSIIKTSSFKIHKLVKLSLDARDKKKLQYILTLDIKSSVEKVILSKNINNNNIMSTNDIIYKIPKYIFSDKSITSPVIIGSGPAGYFAGLYLSRMGFKPIIIERGKPVDERIKDVNNFWENNILNSESNVSFGEGGAGTFSDGKLNTGVKDKTGRIRAVIDDFINFGAPFDISYLSKPHIGTDELGNVMKNLRKEIENSGGQVLFNSRFTGFSYITESCLNNSLNDDHTSGNRLSIEYISNIDGQIKHVETNSLILATGHSARDTFKYLNETKINMEPKPFAIGLRIEHPSDLINKAQFGDFNLDKGLPTADYKMTYHASNGRNVYSFCMCPGGYVVNASSDNEQSVVNGMSNHSRDGRNSNSAIVCNVTPDDYINEGFGEYGVLSGVEFQKKFEKAAFKEGKGFIPVQLFSDYKADRASVSLREFKPDIKGKYSLGNLNNCLPAYVNNAIIEAIADYDRKLKGFGDDNVVLSGVETRTSSPVKIPRNEQFMSNLTGIFPCGEGAGYAGGITSAAVDGIKVAEAVAEYLFNLTY
ncbi:MAG: FAD-dependent oxidoreductase [Lachnospiraceae bacterium]|nr:FAD-dependent oxidoreductase [Lachnospiraceae bacterium]